MADDRTSLWVATLEDGRRIEIRVAPGLGEDHRLLHAVGVVWNRLDGDVRIEDWGRTAWRAAARVAERMPDVVALEPADDDDAVRAEREGCARVADAFAEGARAARRAIEDGHAMRDYVVRARWEAHGCRLEAARAIAEQIRARKTTTTR